MRASNNAPLKLARDISSKRCLCPKSNDLTGHTQSRGVIFAAYVSNYRLQFAAYWLSSCCFGTQDCVICATLQRFQLENVYSNPEKEEPHTSLTILII